VWQVKLRVPLSTGDSDCRDLCLFDSQKEIWLGLEVEYTAAGAHPVDDLLVTPVTANTFCTSTRSATVQNITKADGSGAVTALVTTDSGSCAGSCAVTLPYSITDLDVQIDMLPKDAQMHSRADKWTLMCGGNATGFAVFSFPTPTAPSICSVVVSPFD